MASNEIKIKTQSKEYSIFIDPQNTVKFVKLISLSLNNVLFLIDRNVNKKCIPILKKMKLNSDNHHKMIISTSEKNKSFDTVNKILEYLYENNFDRNSIIVAIGGGVLGDIAGFCASIYMRGIKYFQIPTTILSAVDSSVGGKTGINFLGAKNIIGTFHQPFAVFINPEFFKTLPKSEVISGIGELIKYSLIKKEYYNFYVEETNKIFYNREVSDEVISTSIQIKAEIVEKDEKEETGERKILNLGHTFGHAFEAASNYKLKHGEAVFLGIIFDFLVAENFGFVNQDDIYKFLNDYGFMPLRKSIILQMDSKKVIEFMRIDKKNISGFINLVIPTRDEIMKDFPVEEKLIYRLLEKFKRMFG